MRRLLWCARFEEQDAVSMVLTYGTDGDAFKDIKQSLDEVLSLALANSLSKVSGKKIAPSVQKNLKHPVSHKTEVNVHVHC